MKGKLTRRRLLAGSAALAGGSAYLISTATSEATEISFGNLTIPDVEYRGQEIDSINLAVDAEYNYTSNVNPDRYTIELLIGDQETTLEAIDEVENTDLTQSESGTETLTGSVTETWHFATDSFTTNSGTKTTTVYVGLRFKLIENGSPIAESEVIETVKVTVNADPLEASAELGGVGEITIG